MYMYLYNVHVFNVFMLLRMQERKIPKEIAANRLTMNATKRHSTHDRLVQGKTREPVVMATEEETLPIHTNTDAILRTIRTANTVTKTRQAGKCGRGITGQTSLAARERDRMVDIGFPQKTRHR